MGDTNPHEPARLLHVFDRHGSKPPRGSEHARQFAHQTAFGVQGCGGAFGKRDALVAGILAPFDHSDRAGFGMGLGRYAWGNEASA